MGLFRVSVRPEAAVFARIAVPVRVIVLGLARAFPPKLTFRVVPVASEIAPPVRPTKLSVWVTLRVPALRVVPPV